MTGLQRGLQSEVCHEVRKTNNTTADFPTTRQVPAFEGGWGEALDSGSDLPISCRAAEDKVRPHNDVTYL